MNDTYFKKRHNSGLSRRDPLTEGRAAAQRSEVFRTSFATYLLGGLIRRWPTPWLWISDTETALLSKRIKSTQIIAPIYITGLARSGSTILLEILASINDVVAHRYRDYPLLYTPLLSNWLSSHVPSGNSHPVERPHRDGIFVAPDSPEAFEEILWMTFFPNVHDPCGSSVLGRETSCPKFERFYRDHLRKLLYAQAGKRYVAKANYNVTRLEYLLTLFPDARFVIPVRHPARHIASLIRQNALFCQEQTRFPRMLEHMRRIGHFEFGLDRRPINVGEMYGTDGVRELWQKGAELRGWARYWSDIYGYVARILDGDSNLCRASLVLRFEDLCRSPQQTIGRLLKHCQLPEDESHISGVSQSIRFPDYYRPHFSSRDMDIIESETRKTARRYGLRHGG